ncbi:MAG: hypothetical protein H6Q48_2054, partial [Deltaproteobacteria bacterium]|nr:hypothetical protein [Deltaproteobacteria bacterium]
MIFSETISLRTKGFSDVIDLTEKIVHTLKQSHIQ